MPTPADQIPPDPTSLARRVATLERELRELRAARRLEKASVGKGGLRIVDGGRLAMDTPQGVRMVDIGQITAAQYDHGDGTPQQGVQLRREDGTLFLACFSYPPSGFDWQAWALYDRTGSVVVAEDTNSGQGLARPYLEVPMGPSYEGGWDYWPRTSSTTATPLWEGIVYKQLPRVAVVVRASMDTSGATGELDLTIGGIAQEPPVPVSFSVGYITLGPYPLDYAHMDQITLAVRGRRTSGTGALRASIVSAYNL
ncbi:hypothetical protein AB0M23_28335 [Streptomyces sp. NPDC052077]|uniref:hypothetical protein n=1 Tax=Streptomyces sp. NPDC052077 TaxID=3154757 RepID=UPI00344535B9